MKLVLVSMLGLASLSTLALVACSPANVAAPDGGAASEAGSADGGLDPTQVCSEYAYARCGRIKACSQTEIALLYGDIASCQSSFAQECVNAIDAPSSATTTAHIQACGQAQPARACADVLHNTNLPPECTPVPGALLNGAPCALSNQCASTFCNIPSGSACGTCTVPPNVGDPCQTSANCQVGMTCATATHKCVTYGQLGTACSAAQPCDDGYTCVGGACAAGVETAGTTCAFTGAGCNLYSGLACNAETSACESIVVAGPGQACGLVANQNQVCQDGTCQRGACVAHAHVGGACDTNGGPFCTALTHCVTSGVDGGTTGVCQLLGSSACK
jgi:hypothetical protein